VEESWTILELTELAAEALAATQPTGPSAAAASAPGASAPGASAPGAAAGAASAGPGRANGRVRDVPNERLVRWYVTVGLVDPPLSRRGRVARYGRRHLLQLVAVKRRQAEGRSLAGIQAELAGATDETLAAVARVRAGWPAPQSPAPQAPTPEAPAPAAPTRFWTRASAQDRDPGGAGRIGERDPGGAEQAGAQDPGGAERAGRAVAAVGRGGWRDGGRGDGGSGPAGWGDGGRGGLVHGVRLAPGVTLLLEDAGREPGPQDVTEIVNAARPLLEELASRRLCAFDPGHAADVPGVPPEVGQLAEESRT
jgi:DNA-binding transcriptional MerR regulator